MKSSLSFQETFVKLGKNAERQRRQGDGNELSRIHSIASQRFVDGTASVEKPKRRRRRKKKKRENSEEKTQVKGVKSDLDEMFAMLDTDNVNVKVKKIITQLSRIKHSLEKVGKDGEQKEIEGFELVKSAKVLLSENENETVNDFHQYFCGRMSNRCVIYDIQKHGRHIQKLLRPVFTETEAGQGYLYVQAHNHILDMFDICDIGTIALQAVFRGFALRERFRKARNARNAVVRIQAAVRGMKERTRREEEVKSCKRLQKQWRGRKKIDKAKEYREKEYAATVMQSHVRKKLMSQRYIKIQTTRHDAVTSIQAAVRGMKERTRREEEV
eukprot:g3165.t1